MKVTIKIECEDERELMQHLTKIKKQLKEEFVKQDLNQLLNFRVSDSNCYGWHEAKVKETI